MTTTDIDVPATLTATATLIAAIGALVVSLLGAWRASRAKQAADHARRLAEESKAEIIATKDGVFEVGRQLDGRLKLLIEQTEKSARAEGRTEGRQEERKDAAAGRPTTIPTLAPPKEDK